MSEPSAASGQTYFIRNRGRVQGPFSIDKLKALRARGQFSRVFEVSTDRANWSPGSTLDQFLTPKVATRPSILPAADGRSAPVNSSLNGPPPLAGSAGAVPANDNAVWYYRVDEQQFGPVTTAEVKNLIASGRLGPLDFVWRDGLMEWSTVEDTAELNSRSLAPPGKSLAAAQDERRPRNRLWLVLIVALIVLVAVAGLVYLGVSGKLGALLPGIGNGPANPLPAPAEDPADEPDDADVGRADARPRIKASAKTEPQSGAINSIEGIAAERLLGDCVGLVVTGIRATFPDGSIVEEPHGTGSCFVVSAKGHALTNKHVIEDIVKLQRADLLLEKIKSEQHIKIEPRIWAFFEGNQSAVEIVATVENFDVAILKIDREFKSHLRLSAAGQIARGEKVAALGFPGLGRVALSQDELAQRIKNLQGKKESIRAAFEPRDFQFTRTDGTTSKVETEQTGRVWIQHTAKINPGNSGGPLLTTDGTVHGINTLVVGSTKNGESPLFMSLSVGQLRSAIDRHIPGVEWK